MTTKNLKKYAKRKSFQPFTLATKAGKRFHIDHGLKIGICKFKKGMRS